METYFLENNDILRFYERIAGKYELYVPVKISTGRRVKCDFGFNLPNDEYFLKKYSDTNKEDIVFSEYRSVEPIRSFFTYVKEKVSDYFNTISGESTDRPVAIAGVKNCDLFSLKIQDFVFLGGDAPDPYYKKRRDDALIISSDCPSFKEVCFCRAFDINPHAEEGFDFNLSAIADGFLVDVASDKARKLVPSLKGMFMAAKPHQLSARAEKRNMVIREMEEHLAHHKIPKKETLKEIVLSGFNSPVWNEQMLTCVECGGCVFMCDTCHCFLLFDEPEGENAKRMRIWDGCLYRDFGRVAGGANPLKMRYMRLRNRYLKKFDFFIDNLGYQACCGCGRCIDVCPGKIDIRYILKKLYDEKYLPAH